MTWRDDLPFTTDDGSSHCGALARMRMPSLLSSGLSLAWLVSADEQSAPSEPQCKRVLTMCGNFLA